MHLVSSDPVTGANVAQDDAMRLRTIFWSAFIAGMSGPALLYGSTAFGYSPLSNMTVAQSFGGVGAYLDCTAGNYIYVGTAPEAAATDADAST
jgi:hypothetical protein